MRMQCKHLAAVAVAAALLVLAGPGLAGQTDGQTDTQAKTVQQPPPAKDGVRVRSPFMPAPVIRSQSQAVEAAVRKGGLESSKARARTPEDAAAQAGK